MGRTTSTLPRGGIAPWRNAPKKDRLTLLAEIVARDTSLNAVEYAGRLLSDALEAKLKPLAVKPLLQAWEQKKGSVK